MNLLKVSLNLNDYCLVYNSLFSINLLTSANSNPNLNLANNSVIQRVIGLNGAVFRMQLYTGSVAPTEDLKLIITDS